MLRVIDDFLGDPYTFRNEGLKLYNKEAKRSLNSKYKHSSWPGLRCYVPDFLCKKYVSQVESIVDDKLILRNAYFQWVDETWVSGTWHTDGEYYTIMTFLNLDAPPNTGIQIADNTFKMSNGRKCSEYINNLEVDKISFYRSSKNYYQRYRFKKKLDKFNSSPYFKNACTVPNKFNRTVIFNRLELHRAQKFFGEGKKARFTMIAFCDTIQ